MELQHCAMGCREENGRRWAENPSSTVVEKGSFLGHHQTCALFYSLVQCLLMDFLSSWPISKQVPEANTFCPGSSGQSGHLLHKDSSPKPLPLLNLSFCLDKKRSWIKRNSSEGITGKLKWYADLWGFKNDHSFLSIQVCLFKWHC